MNPKMALTNLVSFLQKNVDDYLLEDLETLKMAERRPGKEGGAVGYPLLIATFAGIELLGSLVSDEPFHPRKGGDLRFAGFWKDYIYPGDRARASAGPELYKIARHGLAHAFVVKGNLEVVKGAPHLHLVKKPGGAISVDAVQLAVDFREAYKKKVRPRVFAGDALAQNMAAQLASMARIYGEQADKSIGNLTLPQAIDPVAPLPAMGPVGHNVVAFASSTLAQGASGPSFPIPTIVKSTP